ncbi:capsid and scaffold protein [Streptococcus phage Javan273]|nr:phage capsid protein [Streptococcus iniae]QBX16762.1 capsid and scaffold protein [Streptococcus phage Javan273]
MAEETNAAEVVEEVDTQKTEVVEEGKQDGGRTFTRADISKMITAERAKWESEQADAVEKARSEGERLAKLSKDQRAKEEEQKRLDAIAEREKAVAEKEMRLETQTLLAEKGLPADFTNVVLAATAEEVKANIDSLQSIFDKAVETRVNERLTQETPRTGNGTNQMTKAEIMAIQDDTERMNAIAANRNLFLK